MDDTPSIDALTDDPYRAIHAVLAEWQSTPDSLKGRYGDRYAREFAADLERLLAEAERMRAWALLRGYVAHQDEACGAGACICGLDALLASLESA